jgi:hypothetical protein
MGSFRKVVGRKKEMGWPLMQAGVKESKARLLS